jgi:hypothetical protein
MSALIDLGLIQLRQSQADAARHRSLRMIVIADSRVPLSLLRLNLNPKSHGARVAALEIAIARQRPQRKKFRIPVITKVKHARKAGRGGARLVPEAVAFLPSGEIGDAARHRGMIDFAGRHQAEQRPSRLRNGRGRGFVTVIVELVA